MAAWASGRIFILIFVRTLYLHNSVSSVLKKFRPEIECSEDPPNIFHMTIIHINQCNACYCSSHQVRLCVWPRNQFIQKWSSVLNTIYDKTNSKFGILCPIYRINSSILACRGNLCRIVPIYTNLNIDPKILSHEIDFQLTDSMCEINCSPNSPLHWPIC